MDEAVSGSPLRRLIDAIVGDDRESFAVMLSQSPELARARFGEGATRQRAEACFVEEVGQYIYAGDTALHFAAAAYRPAMVKELIAAGGDVRARNRRGAEPLHAAASGSPGSMRWDPAAQAATIACLIEAGADPNARNMDGATPLHRAVRTRCAGAVRALLGHGADVAIRNKSGSTAAELALRATGRAGAGSPGAKAEQEEILLLLG